MVSLVDIGSMKDTVTIRGQEVDINGLTAEHIVGIFYRFPDIRKLLTQLSPDPDVVGSLISRFPEAVGCIIAAACGAPDDRNAIEVATKLSIGEQYMILEKIVPLTFPQGAQNFLDGIQRLLQQADGRGWVPVTKSPAPSNGASPPVEASETAGTPPLAS